MKTKTTFFATTLAAALVMSIVLTPAFAAIAKDSRGDVTNGNPNFDIKMIGVNDDGDPYVDVWGKGGATTVNDGDTILAYVLFTDAGVFAVTSHGGIEDSTEVGDDEEFHGHLVTLGAVNESTCVVGITDEGEASIQNKRVAISGTSATTITGALTVSISATTTDGICVTDIFDAI